MGIFLLDIGTISFLPFKCEKRSSWGLTQTAVSPKRVSGLVVAMITFSFKVALESKLRIEALLELAIDKGVPESARLVGLDFNEVLNNPALLRAKYTELTAGCPGFTVTGDERFRDHYKGFLQRSLPVIKELSLIHI